MARFMHFIIQKVQNKQDHSRTVQDVSDKVSTALFPSHNFHERKVKEIFDYDQNRPFAGFSNTIFRVD